VPVEQLAIPVTFAPETHEVHFETLHNKSVVK